MGVNTSPSEWGQHLHFKALGVLGMDKPYASAPKEGGRAQMVEAGRKREGRRQQRGRDARAHTAGLAVTWLARCQTVLLRGAEGTLCAHWEVLSLRSLEQQVGFGDCQGGRVKFWDLDAMSVFVLVWFVCVYVVCVDIVCAAMCSV